MSEIVFIYNAKSGTVNSLIDWVHKIISPDTYECSLCSITYDNFGKKAEWSTFLRELKIKSTFIYKDQIINDQKLKDVPLPCAYLKKSNDINLLISSDEMNSFKSLDELIDSLRKKLEELK
jgi:hypothetical protein